MSTHWKLTAATLATLGLAALPAAASAAASGAGVPLSESPFTITASSPFAACYDDTLTKTLTISLADGTPGDIYEVQLTRGQSVIDSGDGASTGFDAGGDGSVTLTDLTGDFSTVGAIAGVPVTASVIDYPVDGSADSTTRLGTFLLTQLGFSISSTPVNPLRARSFAFSGAFPDQLDYGFIVNKAGTRVLRRFVIGRSNACGYVKSKKVIAPPGAPKGTYRFYIYPSSKLSEHGIPYEPFSITRRSTS